jgi:hypothetical protein
MGRRQRLHDHHLVVTLFDWQTKLIVKDIELKKYRNRRDALEDFVLEHYAKKDHQAAEYLASKKLARRMLRQ